MRQTHRLPIRFIPGSIFLDSDRQGGGLNPLPPSDTLRKQEKNIAEYIFSSVLPHFKKYHPSENIEFNNSGII